jgi:MFS family permease
VCYAPSTLESGAETAPITPRIASNSMPHWIDTVLPRRALFDRDRRLLHLFLGRVLASTGFSIVIPFLALYLHGTRGVPMSAVGLLFFFGALCGAGGQVVGGEWSDKSGRKRVLVACQLIRACAFAGLGVAVTVHASVVIFTMLTGLSAFAGRMFEPPSGAMIADITTGERRIEAYGVLRIGGNLGWAIGPAIGGFLAALSYASLFFVAAGVLLTAATVIAIKVEETHPSLSRSAAPNGATTTAVPAVGPVLPGRGLSIEGTLTVLRDPIFLRYCLVTLLLFTVMGQLMSTFSVYTVEWAKRTKVELGTLYALNGLMVVFLQFPAVRMIGALRMTTALVVGSLFYSVGYGMMGWGSSFALLFASMFVITLGEIITTPPSMNLVANFSPEDLRGRYMGVFGIFNSFGWSIGPLVGGVLLDLAAGRPRLLWGAIACLTVLAALGFADLRRRIDPALDMSPEAEAARPAPVPEPRVAAEIGRMSDES